MVGLEPTKSFKTLASKARPLPITGLHPDLLINNQAFVLSVHLSKPSTQLHRPAHRLSYT